MTQTANLNAYDELKNGDRQAPSLYQAAVKVPLADTTLPALRQRLQKVLDREDVADIVAVESDEDGAVNVVLQAEVPDAEDEDEAMFMFRIRIFANAAPEEWSYEAAQYRNRNLQEDERIEMHQAAQVVECLTYLERDSAQTQLMLQFAVLDAVAGACYALQDLVASQFFSGAWLAEMAQTYTPPSLEMFYVIHAIVPEDEESDDFWLHTHGLLKFGLPELEILRARRDHLQACQGIIQTLAARMLDDPDIWQQDEAQLIAHSDKQDIHIRLMPWQEALTSNLLVPMKKGLFRQKALPFNGDLSGREADDIHTEPGMVIFADMDGHIQPLSAYGDIIGDDSHLMLLLPNSETARMYFLAKEKLPLLAACMRRHPPEAGVWGYMMKIGCTSPSTEATEHMWFVLQDMDAQQVRAELVNDPFEIPEMKSGECYTLPLDEMTDWCIYSSPLRARFAPDDAFALRRYLNAN